MEYPEGTEQTANWIKRHSRLKDERGPWDTTWDEIADHVFPRKGGISQKDYTPNNGRDVRLYDITAQDALERAVAGYMAWTTPKSTPWSEFTPILQQRKSEDVKNWLRECSMLGTEYIANSNFYSERHEALFDKWGFGTDCLFSQVTPDQKTRFEKIRMGSFVFETDSNGQANCIFRELEFTAPQAEEKFGRDNLPKCILEQLAMGDPGTKKFNFLHVVEPRAMKDRAQIGSYEAPNRKAFLSAYVEVSSRKIVEEGGYDSFPFHIGRFLKWDAVNAGADVWGYGPGFSLLPESRQLNFLQKMMDVYAEKAVFPPMAVPDTFEGTLKTSARAVNYYPAGLGADSIVQIPVAGDWSVAFERLKMRQQIIRSKCHLDMFQMFSMNAANNREMTAYEASQLAGEKLDAISPAFDRDAGEVIQPMMIRLFEQWAELGMLPPPPQEAIIQAGPSLVQVPNPTVTMTSRLALAIRALSLRNADSHIATVAQLVPIFPEVADTVNLDWYVRERSRLNGCDPQITRPQEEVDAIRQQRAEMQQMQAAAMMAKDAAGAVKDAGGMGEVKKMMDAA